VSGAAGAHDANAPVWRPVERVAGETQASLTDALPVPGGVLVRHVFAAAAAGRFMQVVFVPMDADQRDTWFRRCRSHAEQGAGRTDPADAAG
jgi:hypothetical protein